MCNDGLWALLMRKCVIAGGSNRDHVSTMFRESTVNGETAVLFDKQKDEMTNSRLPSNNLVYYFIEPFS